MAFTFRPAVREQTSVLVGLAGPSSSGKTYSALRLATGMVRETGGSIFMIDTESHRGLHYADEFEFQHASLEAPFRPSAYLEAIKAAKQAGASVIIVDSQSHEHEGPGGILEWHDEELTKMAGNDMNKRERMKFAAWIKPKQSHNQFVNGVLQVNASIIFCFRAKKKLGMGKDSKGRMEVVDLGWQPICSDRFEYEMTTLLMLPPNGQGVPDTDHESTKLQQQHKAIFPAGVQINEEMGASLAAWAGGSAEKAPAPKSTAKKKAAEKPAEAASQPVDKPVDDAFITKRDRAIEYMIDQGATLAQVLFHMELSDRADITEKHLSKLRVAALKIKDGASVDDVLGQNVSQQQRDEFMEAFDK